MPEHSLGQEIKLTDSSLIPEEAVLSMPGEHNRLNAALAKGALQSLGLDTEVIHEALGMFPGIEGRLQLVKTIDNVRIYNDNNATTPQAATAGLQALDLGNKNIVLISGGADKNIPLESFAAAIAMHCKEVVLTPGNGTDKLVELLKDTETVVRLVDNLQDAVPLALELAAAGDIVLFSPAFASFAQYKNEYERNDEFLQLVEANS